MSKKDKIEKIKSFIPTGQLLHKTVEEVMSSSMLPMIRAFSQISDLTFQRYISLSGQQLHGQSPATLRSVSVLSITILS